MSAYFAAAYWGPRPESIEECLHRTAQFLKALSGNSSSFHGWRKKGRTQKSASMGEIITHDSLETLQSLFESGVNRYDTTKEPIPGLGFGISIWNGKGSNDAVSLSIRCGIDYPSIRLSNSVLISLPSSYDVNDLSAIRALVLAFEESWCPDSITVASSDSVDAHEIGEHFLDIALFLKSSLEDQFEPPLGAISVVMDRGTLFLRG